MPHKPCAEPFCPRFATSRGRCDEHRKERERERSRRRRAEGKRRVYDSKRWLVVRSRVLSDNPICESCGERLATEVDHRIPLSKGGAKFDRENLAATCGPCHWGKTAEENRERGQR
jgi:5-methylcytosine-specific restriction endonuclease McrA